MGFEFFTNGPKKSTARGGAFDPKLCHQLECRICPLNKADARHPHMEPTGAREPIVYVLGDAPGKNDDDQGEQFTGASGQLIKNYLPDDLLEHIRWNNVVRTHPPEGRAPTDVETECCRPSITQDIEQSAPLAIFGFGEVPLRWARPTMPLVETRGRRFPVKIGQHVCWFYSFRHPSAITRAKNSDSGKLRRQGEDDELVFKFDMLRAVKGLDDGVKPDFVTRAQAEANVEIIRPNKDGLDQLTRLLAEVRDWVTAGNDYECSGLRPYRHRLLTIGIGCRNKAFSFPWDHPRAQWPHDLWSKVEQLYKDFLTHGPIKTVHNLAFEMEWTAVKLGHEFIRMPTWRDTLTRAFNIDERSGGRLKDNWGQGQGGSSGGLDYLSDLYFGTPIKSYSNVDRRDMLSAPVETVLRYNAIDSRFHDMLYHAQSFELKRDGLVEATRTMEARVPTVVLSQVKGVLVDPVINEKLYADYSAEKDDIEFQISETNAAIDFERTQRRPFQPVKEGYSNQDVTILVKDVLKSSAGRPQGVGGRWQVDESVLSQLDNEAGPLILKHRGVAKKRATYVEPLRKGSDTVYADGRLHCVFNTTKARTGRLSAEDPSVQNFPIRTDEGRKLREQIVAMLGHTLFSIDFGQIEARVIAMASRDKTFVKALWERYDVHGEWAERLALADPRRVGLNRADIKNKGSDEAKKIMKAFRNDVKNGWTFPLFFGAELHTLSTGMVKMDKDILRPLVNDFWKQFSGARDWQYEVLDFYEKNGYVEYLTGRRYRAPMSTNQLYNYPIQGPTADIVMEAMRRLSERNDPHLQPILQIHDDLTFELPIDGVEDYAEIIISEMLDVRYPFVNVPITLEAKEGPNWGNMAPIGDFSSDLWLDGKFCRAQAPA